MSAAETLQEAARLMRERAEGATPGPWYAPKRVPGPWCLYPCGDPLHGEDGACWGVEVKSQVKPGWNLSAATGHDRHRGESDSAHIASWHPTIALAVADWLEATTAYPYEDCGKPDCGDCGMWRAALSLARAYLGEAS
jgi:hypothetical protein